MTEHDARTTDHESLRAWMDAWGSEVAAVDLGRYAGKWYEIAAFPMFFQRQCVGDTTAEYARRADGDLSTYTPDFIVKDAQQDVWVIETKGREELDLPRKMARLAQWCEDATAASHAEGGPAYRFIYVDQEGFERHPPASLAELAAGFREYQRV